MLSDAALNDLASRLVAVPGVVAVALGGSRARNEHHAGSDVDLGLYYDGAIDTAVLGRLARAVGGDDAAVTGHGDWGPWVDGGGWLRIDGTAVDWIYRDLARVESAVDAAQRGDTRRHQQLGHPFGVAETLYAAELAAARVLADPADRLQELRGRLTPFPPLLRAGLVDALGEADFVAAVAKKGAIRGDSAYVAGCLFQALVTAAVAIHADAGSWVSNEKGAIASAGRLPAAPVDFAARAQSALAALGTTPDSLVAAIDAVAALVAETRASVTRPSAARPSA